MLNAENRELYHAVGNVVPPDDSLAPRAVAVTLLAFGDDESICRSARPILDALAHLAGVSLTPDDKNSPLAASLIRMSVFAGVDATWFLEKTCEEALDTKPMHATLQGEVMVCVRWVNQNDAGALRSEFHTLPTGRSLDQSLQALQNCFLSMKIYYGAPFPTAIANAHTNVVVDAWAQALHTASEAFFELTEGTPCVHLAHALNGHEHEVNIESTGITARVCPRFAQGPSSDGKGFVTVSLTPELAAARADCFHAFLVGNAACHSDVATFAKVHEQEGLPPPNEETARYCLHTCAVQASVFQLRERVSLYATHHKVGGRLSGTPISTPGSWVWRFEPAIVALEAVLPNFYVLPCADESAFPGDRKLERPFNDFFSRAFQLYAATFGAVRGSVKSKQPFERMPLELQEMTDNDDPSIRAAEDFALTAFSLDASSRRVSVGDAFASLQACRAPRPLTEFMLQASLRLGIGASVLDGISSAAQALRQMANTTPEACEAKNNEIARLKRVADAAIGNPPKKSCVLQPPTVPLASVKPLLTALRLCKHEDGQLPRPNAPPDEYISVVSVVAGAVLSKIPDESTISHACQVAKRARPKGDIASLSAAITVLRGSDAALPAPAFVIAQNEGSSQVSFNRMGFNGAFETATAGQLVDAPQRAVLLMHSGAKGVKITSTKCM